MLMPCWKLILNELLCFSNVADSECQVYFLKLFPGSTPEQWEARRRPRWSSSASGRATAAATSTSTETDSRRRDRAPRPRNRWKTGPRPRPGRCRRSSAATSRRAPPAPRSATTGAPTTTSSRSARVGLGPDLRRAGRAPASGSCCRPDGKSQSVSEAAFSKWKAPTHAQLYYVAFLISLKYNLGPGWSQ